MRSALIVVPVISALLAGCATGTQVTSARGSRNVIGAEELAAAPEGTAYDVIRRLRPTWLTRRSVDAAMLPVVFIDNVRAGELDQLRSISVDQVAELRYIPARDATTRWGTGYTGGVIEVILKVPD